MNAIFEANRVENRHTSIASEASKKMNTIFEANRVGTILV